MPAGRPKKEIDQVEFEKLCGLQCTEQEICGWFETTDKTLDRWCVDTYGEHFSEIYAKKRETGKISLRRAQFQLAQKSASMAIFLGKNYLGQRDTMTVTQDAELGKLDKLLEDFKNAVKSEAE